MNFMGLLGMYFHETHALEVAQKYNGISRMIAPDYLMAKRLNRKLPPNLFDRFVEMFDR